MPRQLRIQRTLNKTPGAGSRHPKAAGAHVANRHCVLHLIRLVTAASFEGALWLSRRRRGADASTASAHINGLWENVLNLHIMGACGVAGRICRRRGGAAADIVSASGGAAFGRRARCRKSASCATPPLRRRGGAGGKVAASAGGVASSSKLKRGRGVPRRRGVLRAAPRAACRYILGAAGAASAFCPVYLLACSNRRVMIICGALSASSPSP